MADNVFKVEMQPNYTCKITFGRYERLAVMDVLAKCAQTHERMAKWMNDPGVSEAEKETYQQTFQNLLQTISFLWDVLKRAGATEKELKEHMDIPF